MAHCFTESNVIFSQNSLTPFQMFQPIPCMLNLHRHVLSSHIMYRNSFVTFPCHSTFPYYSTVSDGAIKQPGHHYLDPHVLTDRVVLQHFNSIFFLNHSALEYFILSQDQIHHKHWFGQGHTQRPFRDKE